MKFIDHTNAVFGRLTVIKFAGRNALKKVLWSCQCACGNMVVVTSGSLVTGNTTSCGCYLQERITKHKGTGLSSYNTWRAIKRRCLNPNDKDYPKYGAVGITLCDEWLNYETFRTDMGEPEGDQTLDRIDPYGNYNKSNCRWASLTVQARNLRIRKTSKTGAIGVAKIGKKFMAKITLKKKAYYSKMCDTLEEAINARKELEQKYWR